MSNAGFTMRREDWPLRAITSTDVIREFWRLIKPNGGAQSTLQGSRQGSGRPETPDAFPTVLIAAENPGMRQSMANHLGEEPCNVLQADSAVRLWDAIVNHSRAIHVLLTELKLVGPDFAKMAKLYRPGMRILFVANDSDQSQPEVLPAGAAAMQARELLRLRI
jgi:hypothetical protein